jgi:hypothetical protein
LNSSEDTQVGHLSSERLVLYLQPTDYTPMPENNETQTVKANIQKWLLEDGYKVEMQQDPKTLYKFVATDVSGIKIMIIQPILTIDQIIFAAGISFDNAQQGLLNSLSEKERWNFLWDLRFGLLNLDVSFRGVGLPLQHIEIEKAIHYDGLAKEAFLTKMSNVKRAVIYTMWTFDRKFGEAKPKSDLMVR